MSFVVKKVSSNILQKYSDNCIPIVVLFFQDRDPPPIVVLQKLRAILLELKAWSDDADWNEGDDWCDTFRFAKTTGLSTEACENFDRAYVLTGDQNLDAEVNDATLTRLEGDIGLLLLKNEDLDVSLIPQQHGVHGGGLVAVGLTYPPTFKGNEELFKTYKAAE
jgi:hypothetical protein